MTILVLSRIPFPKVRYDIAIDHERHDVVYLGAAENLALIPAGLRCRRVTKPADVDVLAFASATFRDEPLDAVVALSEYDLLPAAAIRRSLGVPGASCEDVLRVRDKLLMKECAAALGLAVPRNRRLDRFLEDPASRGLRGKLVLKPRDGASSENIRMFGSAPELERALRLGTTGIEALAGGAGAQLFEVEEFVEGPILHMDGWVKAGEIQDFVPSRYMGTCLDYALGRPMGSYQLADRKGAYKAWARKAVRAVGIRNGAFHLEGIMSRDGLVFLEIAHRVGGAGVAATFERKTGVNLYHAHLRSELGLGDALGGPGRPAPEFHGWFVFPGHPHAGEPVRITGTDAYRDRPEVLVWREQAQGEPMAGSRDHISYQPAETPISGELAASSSAGLERFMSGLFESARVEKASPFPRFQPEGRSPGALDVRRYVREGRWSWMS